MFYSLAGGSFITSNTGALDDSDDESSDDDDTGDTGDIDDDYYEERDFQDYDVVTDGDSKADWEKKFNAMIMSEDEPLPLRFATNVDTRIKSNVQTDSGRRYFIYSNDRMKEDLYNLEQDNIVRNPEEVCEVEEMLDDTPTEIPEEPIREYIDNKVSRGLIVVRVCMLIILTFVLLDQRTYTRRFWQQ